MGYNSSYELTVAPVNQIGERLETPISNGLAKMLSEEVQKLGVFEVEHPEESTWIAVEDTWIYQDEDMTLLSMKFPTVVFCIHREGEAAGDLSDTYYWRGKMQFCPAIIEYDDYDPMQLEPPKNIERVYSRQRA